MGTNWRQLLGVHREMKRQQNCAYLFFAAGLAIVQVSPSGAQVPPSGQALPSPSAFNYTRTVSFQYNDPNGYLTDGFVEPNDPQSCVHVAYLYDGYGNKKSTSELNCTGASGDALISSRSDLANFTNLPAQAGIVNGQYPFVLTNAKSQNSTLLYDARFGLPSSHADANSPPLTTQWQYDAVGHKILETRPDGTRTSWTYEYCAQGTIAGVSCPAAAVGTLVSRITTTEQDKNGGTLGPIVRKYQDTLGRNVRTESQNFDGLHWNVSEVVYDALGRLYQKAEPYVDTSPPTIVRSTIVWTTYSYDVLNRITAVSRPDPVATNGVAVTTITYSGLVTTTTNPRNQTNTETRDSQGQVVKVTDALGSVLVRQFDAFGNLVTTIDQYGNATSAKYDLRGRKWALSDADLGLWLFGYDVTGALVRQQSPKQASVSHWTTVAYDVLGRMTQRSVDEYTSTWSYDAYSTPTPPCSGGVGKLCEEATTQLDDRKYSYDSNGRLVNETLAITNGPTFSATTAYDPTSGRISSRTYPTGFAVSYNFNATGYPYQVINSGDGTLIWQANRINARGQLELETLGNGLQTQHTFDPTTGRIAAIQSQPTGGGIGSLINISLGWDSVNNLVARTDFNGDGSGIPVSESFFYDGLNRLYSYSVASATVPSGVRTVTIGYNEIGNILNKSDVYGTYSYPASGAGSIQPHAVTQAGGVSYFYDANGNVTSASGGGLWTSVTPTSFNLPGNIVGTSSQYFWRYGPDFQRLREDRNSAGTTRTTWFFQPDNEGGLSFEQEIEPDGTIVNRHYISIGQKKIATFSSSGTGPVAISRKDYWHVDHLGSIIGVSNATGAVTQRYAFDAFGKRRFVDGNFDGGNALFIDWTHFVDRSTAGALITTVQGSDRGFTGHENLDDVGLVHMNGRFYDANLARFMQADPVVQNSRALQSFNRFSYVANNPLNASDPSGFTPGYCPVIYILDGNNEGCNGFGIPTLALQGAGGSGGNAGATGGTQNTALPGQAAANLVSDQLTGQSMQATDSAVLGASSLLSAINSLPPIAINADGAAPVDGSDGNARSPAAILLTQTTLLYERNDVFPELTITGQYSGTFNKFGDEYLPGWLLFNCALYYQCHGKDWALGAFNAAGAFGGEIFAGVRGTVIAARGAMAARGSTTLYRAVRAGELADIQAAKAYRSLAGQNEGKYFFDTAEQASNFAKMSADGAYTTTSVEVSARELSLGERIMPAGEGPGYFFSTPNIPAGPVNIFDYSVLP